MLRPALTVLLALAFASLGLAGPAAAAITDGAPAVRETRHAPEAVARVGVVVPHPAPPAPVAVIPETARAPEPAVTATARQHAPASRATTDAAPRRDRAPPRGIAH